MKHLKHREEAEIRGYARRDAELTLKLWRQHQDIVDAAERRRRLCNVAAAVVLGTAVALIMFAWCR